MADCIFYYDESEHSRKINYNTVSADNYYDNFVSMIVGWSSQKPAIEEKYALFEKKYAERKDKFGELKSQTLNQNQFIHGFASLNKANVQFLSDFLNVFDQDTLIYFSVISKIEHIIRQLFEDYENDWGFDADALKYSITKALIVYRPLELIKCIYDSPADFVEQLKLFFNNCIQRNKENPQLKELETEAFRQALVFLEKADSAPNLQWDYHMPFEGFKKYLQEKGIKNISFVIDKEGEADAESNTLKAAKDVGFQNASEDDSKQHIGLRISDMSAGVISKLMKAIHLALRYDSFEDGSNKKLLSNEWFCLTEEQLALYKRLFLIICEWQPAWYKSYTGYYADDLLMLNSLLNFMNHFESVKQIRKDIEMQSEYFNAYACEQLSNYFERRKCKLPLDPVIPFDNESFLTQRGARVFYDQAKQPFLPILEGSQTYDVLAVGVDKNFLPSVTVLWKGTPTCFQLPSELSDWACTMVAMAMSGIKTFPSKAAFSKIGKKYYVDLL